MSLKPTAELLQQYRADKRQSRLNEVDSGQGVVGDIVDATQQGLYEGVAGIGEFVGADGLRDWAKAGAAEQNLTISARGREAMGKQFFETDNGDDSTLYAGDAWSDPRAIAMQLGRVIGMNADIVASGGTVTAGRLAVTKVAKVARQKMLAKGATPELADVAAKEASKTWLGKKMATHGDDAKALAGNVFDYGTAGHAVSSGLLAIDIRDEVNETDFEQLADLPEYQQLVMGLKQANPQADAQTILAEARSQLGEQAASAIKTNPTLLTANMLVGGLGTTALVHILRGVVPKGAGIATELAVEGTQGAMEQVAMNQEGQRYVDADRQLTDDVLVAGLNEAVMGGAMGAAAAGGRMAYDKTRAALDKRREAQRAGQLDASILPVPEDGTDELPAAFDPVGKSPVNTFYDKASETAKVNPAFAESLIELVRAEPQKVKAAIAVMDNYVADADYAQRAERRLNRYLYSPDEVQQEPSMAELYGDSEPQDADMDAADFDYLQKLVAKQSPEFAGKLQQYVQTDPARAGLAADVMARYLADPAFRPQAEQRVNEYLAEMGGEPLQGNTSAIQSGATAAKVTAPAATAPARPEVEWAKTFVAEHKEVNGDLPPADLLQDTFDLTPAELDAVLGVETAAAAPAAEAEPLALQVEDGAQQAATSVQNDLPEPTQGQIKAGNYKKGKVKLHGLEISVENPRGSMRKGTDPDGRNWEVELQDSYGYIRRTTGADNEQVDVFIGSYPESDRVFVVDQVNADGSFDEHKVILGATNMDDAVETYSRNYEQGWTVGPVTEMSVPEFKNWLKDGDTKAPIQANALLGKEVKRNGALLSEDKFLFDETVFTVVRQGKNDTLEATFAKDGKTIGKRKFNKSELEQAGFKLGTAMDAFAKRESIEQRADLDMDAFNEPLPRLTDEDKRRSREEAKRSNGIENYLTLQWSTYRYGHDSFAEFMSALPAEALAEAEKRYDEGDQVYPPLDTLADKVPEKYQRTAARLTAEYAQQQMPEQPALVVEDYSDKSIVVRGDTKPYKAQLQALKGVFNPRLKGGAGWVFGKKREDEIRAAIDEINAQSNTTVLQQEDAQNVPDTTTSVAANGRAAADKNAVGGEAGRTERAAAGQRDSGGAATLDGAGSGAARGEGVPAASAADTGSQSADAVRAGDRQRGANDAATKPAGQSDAVGNTDDAGAQPDDSANRKAGELVTARSDATVISAAARDIAQYIDALQADKLAAKSYTEKRALEKRERELVEQVKAADGNWYMVMKKLESQFENDHAEAFAEARKVLLPVDKSNSTIDAATPVVVPVGVEQVEQRLVDYLLPQFAKDTADGKTDAYMAAKVLIERPATKTNFNREQSEYQNRNTDIAGYRALTDALNSVDQDAVIAGLAEQVGAYRDEQAKRIKLKSELDNKAKAQIKAESVPFVLGDVQNVRDSLPYLDPLQQDDVIKAEQRLYVQNGRGMLLANGTGTGKTFSGGGVIKRAMKRGAKRVLVVSPAGMTSDWQQGLSVLQLDAKPLANTQDAGADGTVSLTSYENFYQNKALLDQPWDLLVYDESHKLMGNMGGEETQALNVHRMLSRYTEYSSKLRARHLLEDEATAIQAKIDALISKEAKRSGKDHATVARELDTTDYWAPYEKKVDALAKKYESWYAEKQTKTLFLSASPFATHQALFYMDGYVFDSKEGASTSQAYNTGSPQQQFLVKNLGYRMRYNKANRPDKDVDVGLLERELADKLVESGAMSIRRLEVEKDYSREFVHVSSMLGQKLQQGFDVLREPQFSHLHSKLRDIMKGGKDHELLEALRAKESINRIKQHLALGRKVVVFHERQEISITHPFRFPNSVDAAYMAQLDAFKQAYPELYNLPLTGLNSVPAQLEKAFGRDALALFSGKLSKKQREKELDDFKDDAGGRKILVIQKQAGKEGISPHDVTGKHPRALMIMNTPVSPTDLIQMEGRVFRRGLASNAVIELPIIGTQFEMHRYRSVVSERTGTAENLAMGSQARDLRNVLREGYLDPRTGAPDATQGIGGKEADKKDQTVDALTKAKTYYWKRAKKTSKNKAAEGKDYFATPEPIGLALVKMADIKPGDKALEPSGGHGAIARWLPDTSTNVAIELSKELSPELALVTDGKVIEGNFYDHHIVNKYHSIVMNPPFGHGGSDAIKFVEKSFNHLYNGGRMVAIIPRGKMDERFDDWLKAQGEAHLVATIELPGITFSRAGTGVMTRVVIVDKNKRGSSDYARNINLSQVGDINELFERVYEIDVRPRPDVTIPAADVGMYQQTNTRQGRDVLELSQTRAKPGIDKNVLKKLADRFNGEVDKDSWGDAVYLFEAQKDVNRFLEAMQDKIDAAQAGVELDIAPSLAGNGSNGVSDGRSVNGDATGKANVKVSLDVGKAIAARFDAGLADSGRGTIVAESFNQFPDEIQKLPPALRDAPAFLFEGRVYVNLQYIQSEQDLQNTLVHERLRHYGVRKVFGADVFNQLQKIYLSLGDRKVKALADKYGVDMAAYQAFYAGKPNTGARILDEVLAHITEADVPARTWGLIGELKTRLKLWVNKVFGDKWRYNEADVFNLIAIAKRAVTGKPADFTAAYLQPHLQTGFIDNTVLGAESDNAADGDGIRFSQANVSAGQLRGRGVPVADIEAMAAKFMKGLNGASGIKVKVLRDQAEAQLEWQKSLDGMIVKGAYFDKLKTVYLIASNAESLEGAKRTLAHEVLAHGGLKSVIGPVAYKQFLERIKRTRGNASFARYWQIIDNDYAKFDEDTKAEELFARFVEEKPTQGSAKHWWTAFTKWLRGLLARAGVLAETDADMAAMDAMLASIVQNFKQGRALRRQAGAAVAYNQQVASRVNMHFKDVVKRTPALKDAAARLKAGEIGRDEYDRIVDQFKPVEAYKTLPVPATHNEIAGAVAKNKADLIGLPSRTLKQGDVVGLRLDIPAYSNHGVWVVTVHEGKKDGRGGSAGKVIGYESVAAISAPNLAMAENAAMGIATGQAKGTIATIGGKWEPLSQAEIVQQAKAALASPDWVQIGIDPERHSYFYNRATMQPVTGGERALQIGGLVLVKNPVYGSKNDFLFSQGADGADARDANFKRWFGNSKVVDTSGAPRVVYHGSPIGGINVFKSAAELGYTGEKVRPYDTAGLYFSSNQSLANAFAANFGRGGDGTVYPVYLSMKNPLVVDGPEPISKGLKGLLNRIKYGRQRMEAESQFNKFRNGERQTSLISESDISLLKQYGYDGIINEGDFEYVVFDPAQVKSAIGNNGEFDSSNADIRFSLASRGAQAVQDGITALQQTRLEGLAKVLKPSKIWQAIKLKWPDLRPAMLATLPRNYLGDIAGKFLPSLAAYNKQVMVMEAERNELLSKTHETADAWRKLVSEDRKTSEQLAELMHEATLIGVDPSNDKYVPNITKQVADVLMRRAREFIKSRNGEAWAVSRGMQRLERIKEALEKEPSQAMAYAQLRKAYLALPETHQAMFKQVRDDYRQMSQRRREALEDRIKDLIQDKRVSAAQIAMMQEEFELADIAGVYFPLQRFGNYWAVAKDASTGETLAYSMFETNAEMQKWVKEQAAEGVITDGGYKRDYSKVLEGVGAGFMKDLLKQMAPIFDRNDKLQDEVYQLFLQHSPELSMRKHMIHRKGVKGFDADALRAYAHNMFHGAYQVAKTKHTHHMQSHLMAMADEASGVANLDDKSRATQVVNEMQKRNDWILNPQGSEFAAKMTGFGFFWYLGTSPAAALVNITQTPMIGLPVLGSRYGYKGAAKALLDASKAFIKGRGHVEKALTGLELDAFRAFEKSGVIDKTQAHDVTGIADGGVAYSPRYHKVMKVAGFMFHHAERFNREVTAMAAYRLAFAKVKQEYAGKPANVVDALAHAKAIDMAMELVKLSHFDYANSNRARVIQSDAARVLLLFRQHSINMTYRLLRDFQQSFWGAPEDKAQARKQLAGILGIGLLFSGAAGLPLYSVVAGIFNTLGGDEDEPFNFDHAVRAALTEAIGETAASLVMNGTAGTLTGADLTGRIGMNNLWFREPDVTLEGEAVVQYYAEQALGPIFGIATGWGRAAYLANQGDTARAWEAAVPKFARDWFKSVRFAQEGVLSRRGDAIIDELSPWQIALQANGFTPLELSEQYRDNSHIKTTERVILERRKLLMNRYALGKRLYDADLVDETLDAIAKFNEANPSVKITAADRVRSLKQRAAISERAANGVILSKKLAYLQQEN